MRTLLFSACTLLALAANAQNKPEDTEVWDPVPKVISPGTLILTAPSDAIILFNGKDLNSWTTEDGSPAKWEIKNDALTVKAGAGIIKTKEKFEDFQLHHYHHRKCNECRELASLEPRPNGHSQLPC